MQFTLVGMAVAAEDPAASAAWFARRFGFKAGIDLGWYMNTQHPDHSNLSLDFVQRDHESWPAATRGKTVVTEPWGQRRFQVAGPDGLLIEVLQLVAPDPQRLADNDMAG